MRKLAITLISLFILNTISGQTIPNCDDPIMGADCYYTEANPEDGSGSLGLSYNHTACGLNFVQASLMTTTRYTPSPGSGYPATLTISGMPVCANVVKAFVWWSGGGTANNPNFTFNGNPMVGTRVGTHGSKCWGTGGTETYRADVTAAVTGNGGYTFSSPIGNDIDGATLMIIYSDPTAAYEGTIMIADGAISAATSPSNQTLTGMNVCANTVNGKAFVINSDMQNNVAANHTCTMNGVGPQNFPNSFYNFDEIPTNFTVGQTTCAFQVAPTGGDCYLWSMMGIYYQTTSCVVCSTPPSTLTASSTTTDATCGNCDGTATVNVTGAVGPLTYTWNTIPAQTSQTATNLCPGTYIVTAKDVNCETVMDTVTIVLQNTPPSPVINPAGPFCVNDTAINLTVSIPGGSWMGNGVTDTINGTFDPNMAGQGTHQIIYTDTGICALKDTIDIVVNPLPTLTITNILVCNGDTVPASNFISNPVGATYVWTNSNSAIGLASSGTGNLPLFVATNSTNSPITSTVTVTPTANGCEGLPVTFTITVNPTPIAIVPNNLNYCSGDTVPAITFTTNPSGGTFTWTNSNTAIGLSASGTGGIPQFIATNTGSTAITSTITVIPTVNGCEGQPVTFTITVNPNNLVAGPGSMVCLGDSIILTAANSGLGTITWYDDPNGTNVIGTGTPFYPSVQDTGTYVFYVNEVGGCATNLDSIIIVVRGVNAIINANPTSGVIPLNVLFGNGSTTGPNISYLWDFGTGDTSSLFQPTYTYNNDGTYTVMLVVTDGFCYDTAYVAIDATKESLIVVPNVFTPNGDGSNDVFKLIELNLVSVEGEIYNRWGQKLYSWNGLNGSWDGKSSGKIVPDGTYFYLIKALGADDKEHLLKGSFSLIK